jgi:hypothetical protein
MPTTTWRFDRIHPGLAPGQSDAFSWGPNNELSQGSFTITLHPKPGGVKRTYFWLTTSEVSIGKYDSGTPPVDNVETYFWAKFTNNGLAGQGTVKEFTVYLTRHTS